MANGKGTQTNGNGSNHRDILSLIWSIAELLRGPYKESEYGKVVLPFTVLRRGSASSDRARVSGRHVRIRKNGRDCVCAGGRAHGGNPARYF